MKSLTLGYKSVEIIQSENRKKLQNINRIIGTCGTLLKSQTNICWESEKKGRELGRKSI